MLPLSESTPLLESMVRARDLINTLHSLTDSLDALTAGAPVPEAVTSFADGQRPSLFASLSQHEKEAFLAKLNQGLLTPEEVKRHYETVMEARHCEELYPSALAVPPTTEQLEQTCGRFTSNRERIADAVTGSLMQKQPEGESSFLMSQVVGGSTHCLSSNNSRSGLNFLRRDTVSVTRVVREYEEKLVEVARKSREEGYGAGFVDGERTGSEKVRALEHEVHLLKDKLRLHETLARSCFKQKEVTDGKMAFAREQRTRAESQLSRLVDVEQLRAENAALQYERDVFYAAAVKAQAPHMARLERVLAATNKQIMELFDTSRRR
jgi:hypothetical protein